MEINEFLLTIDDSEPVTFEEFQQTNTAEDVNPLSEEDFEKVKALQVGKSTFLEYMVEIKRVK